MAQNRRNARKRIAELVDDLINGSESRSSVKADIERRKKENKRRKSAKKYSKEQGDGTEQQ